MHSFFKTSFAVGCAALVTCFASVSSARAQVASVQLIAGQNTVMGNVEAFALDGLLFINITSTGNWELDLVHIAIGESLADIPTNGKGNPKIGNFPFHADGGAGVQEIFLVLPLPSEQCDVPFVVAVHAEVQQRNGLAGKGYNAQTAWGDGFAFTEKGGSWATYFEVGCLPPDDPGPY